MFVLFAVLSSLVLIVLEEEFHVVCSSLVIFDLCYLNCFLSFEEFLLKLFNIRFFLLKIETLRSLIAMLLLVIEQCIHWYVRLIVEHSRCVFSHFLLNFGNAAQFLFLLIQFVVLFSALPCFLTLDCLPFSQLYSQCDLPFLSYSG